MRTDWHAAIAANNMITKRGWNTVEEWSTNPSGVNLYTGKAAELYSSVTAEALDAAIPGMFERSELCATVIARAGRNM